ncbi:MAG: glycosyltransferase, partial [Mariprofundaceae bacterium]|nr:glycosyltransferase [Mariprofundaceae bacterium]
MMRVLHLITRMDGGGSAANTLLCATAQQREGHAVVLAFGSSHESAMSVDERQRVEEGLRAFREVGGCTETVSALMRRPGLHDWRAWRQIRRLVEQGFDIVHTHTSKAGALGRLAAAGRAKVVHTPHGHIFHGYFGPLATYAFARIERWLAGRCDALIALTQAERDDHLRLGIGRRAQWHVVPSGVDVEAIAEQVAVRRNASPPAWDAVSVGRLVPVKGMDRLIRAWESVCRRRSEARLAIIGDGPERERLQAMCRELGIQEQVHFPGWVDPVPYLAAARCFCLLSFNEGMGRAVVEAFAASLPCVVADVCGLSELVDDHVGVRVRADEPEEVADALLRE